ncbi:MAG TPA: gamma-glutamyltransferase [Gammaproteobacteria bacterium]|nr:gamma-glutamyltransferase [Gammaproteobacteria bacterium]
MSSHGFDRVTGEDFTSRSEVIAAHGMVASSHPLATQIGLEILKQGGSAVDAAIAVNAALGLMEPTGNGIGGDLFAIVWDAKSKKLYGLNASGPAPKKLSLEYFQKNNLSEYPEFGPLPVTVPGAVAGWSELHKKFGKLPIDRLFKPTIAYAREGFPVTETIAYYFALNKQRFQDYPNFKEVWMANGDVPKTGDIFKNPALGNTLETLADKGLSEFYTGDIARITADFIQAQGGFLSYDDLASYRPEWVQPISTDYRGYEVWELPPNTQGLATLQILNILEGFNLAELGLYSTEYIHLFIEAKKLAFADRAKFYADPRFAKLPIETLLSKDYATKRRQEINPKKAALVDASGLPQYGDTVYLTTADQDGNMVSLIQSNYSGMGSGMTPPELGFMLQNRGTLFSLDPKHLNVVAGGKRSFHTIIPAFVTKDGDPYISFGVMGGATQPQAQAQVLINIIDFGMNLQEAGDAPRIVHSGSSQPSGERMRSGGTVSLESAFDEKIRKELVEMGHTLKYEKGSFGGYQAIMKKNGVYYGASESRKDGQAAGY